MKRFGAALCLVFAAACVPSTTKTEITNVVQENPTGAVGGIALDYFAGTPLSGAAVTLFTGRGPLTAMTDDKGFYTFPEVPVGSFTVVLNVTGYGPAVLVGTLDSQDPNRPVTNPQTTLNPVGLIKLDQTFSVRVVDEAGNPVAGAVLSVNVPIQFVEWVTSSTLNNGVTPTGRGSFIVTATSGADGTAAIAGLPAFAKLLGILSDPGQITVNVAPILVTGSTLNYSFNGGAFSFDLLDLNGTGLGSGDNGKNDLPTIVLEQPDNALKVVKSSIEYLEKAVNGQFTNIGGVVGASVTGPITIQFNNAINSDAKTISVQVLELAEGLPLGGAPTKVDVIKPSTVSFTPAVNGNVVTLTPSAAPAAGKSYWMSFSVQALQKAGGTARVFTTSFPFWGPLNTDVAVTAAKQLDRSCQPTNINDISPADQVTFLFNEPIGTGLTGLDFSDDITFDCGVYYASAEFNGVPGTGGLVTGEIDGSGNIVCDPAAPGSRGDIRMVPTSLPSFATSSGFSSKWAFFASAPTQYVCESSTACTSTSFTRPGAGMHKITFRFQSGAKVVRRLNGAPVPDITIEIPTSATGPAPSACAG